MQHMTELLREAHRLGSAEVTKGVVASYIPELAKTNPRYLGIAVRTLDNQLFEVGDSDVRFTFQSISKVFALALLLRERGPAFLDGLSCEPSGDAFHSIVRLEEEQGRPRNPYINAGAILVSDLLPGASAADRVAGLQSMLAELCDGEAFPLDEKVYKSESASGFRNRALANFMKHHHIVDNPEIAVDTYFRQCSLALDTRRLTRAGLFLANKGVDPVTGTTVFSEACNRITVALMATCGLYDEVGRFAMSVGLPAKSGVSGAILALVPGQMTIAVFGPALGPKGNSVAGMRVLQFLSEELGLSLYG